MELNIDILQGFIDWIKDNPDSDLDKNKVKLNLIDDYTLLIFTSKLRMVTHDFLIYFKFLIERNSITDSLIVANFYNHITISPADHIIKMVLE